MEAKQKWDEKLMWQKILSKDLMELKDDKEVKKFALDYVIELRKTDMNRFSDASELVKRLGVGGLWKGIDIAIMLTAQKLQDHSKFFTQPKKLKGEYTTYCYIGKHYEDSLNFMSGAEIQCCFMCAKKESDRLKGKGVLNLRADEKKALLDYEATIKASDEVA